MKTNAGTQKMKMEGAFLGVKKKVWFDRNSHANVFSFALMSDQYDVWYNNDHDDAFYIEPKNKIECTKGKNKRFTQTKEGLYTFRFKESIKIKNAEMKAAEKKLKTVKSHERVNDNKMKLQQIVMDTRIKHQNGIDMSDTAGSYYDEYNNVYEYIENDDNMNDNTNHRSDDVNDDNNTETNDKKLETTDSDVNDN